MVLDIIRDSKWNEGFVFDNAGDTEEENTELEHQWFYRKMLELPDRGKLEARLPSPEAAMTFSVESVWYDKPLGYHRVQRWHSDKMDEVDKWCPEHRMVMD